jgi:hypothetical protein
VEVLRLSKAMALFYVCATNYDLRPWSEHANDLQYRRKQQELADRGGAPASALFPPSLFVNEALNDYLKEQDLHDRDSEFYRWWKDTSALKKEWRRGMLKLFRYEGNSSSSSSEVPSESPLSLQQREEVLRLRLLVDRHFGVLSVYSFPFLLSTHNKAKLLQLEARVEQRNQEDQEIQNARRLGQSHINTHRLYVFCSVLFCSVFPFFSCLRCLCLSLSNPSIAVLRAFSDTT